MKIKNKILSLIFWTILFSFVFSEVSAKDVVLPYLSASPYEDAAAKSIWSVMLRTDAKYWWTYKWQTFDYDGVKWQTAAWLILPYTSSNPYTDNTAKSIWSILLKAGNPYPASYMWYVFTYSNNEWKTSWWFKLPSLSLNPYDDASAIAAWKTLLWDWNIFPSKYEWKMYYLVQWKYWLDANNNRLPMLTKDPYHDNAWKPLWYFIIKAWWPYPVTWKVFTIDSWNFATVDWSTVSTTWTKFLDNYLAWNRHMEYADCKSKWYKVWIVTWQKVCQTPANVSLSWWNKWYSKWWNTWWWEKYELKKITKHVKVWCEMWMNSSDWTDWHPTTKWATMTKEYWYTDSTWKLGCGYINWALWLNRWEGSHWWLYEYWNLWAWVIPQAKQKEWKFYLLWNLPYRKKWVFWNKEVVEYITKPITWKSWY